MKSRRYVHWLIAFALSLMPLVARAETASPAPTTQQLQQLVATLKDDKARTQLIGELQALIAARNAQHKAQESSPLSWITDLPTRLNAVGAEILASVPVLLQTPRIFAWLELQVSDPGLRARWIDIITKLVTIFGAGFVADWLARALLRRPARQLKAVPNENLPIRLLLVAVAALVEALPALVFAAVAAFVLPLSHPQPITRAVASVLITTTVWARSLLAVGRSLLLSPRAQALYTLGDETRNYLYIWMRRFAYSAAYGYAASLCAWWLGAPGAIDGLLMRVTILVLAIFAIVFVLQNRTAVSEWLRGYERVEAAKWRILRRRLAESWHILAIIYVIATFGVYVLNTEGGFVLLLRATALSLIVLTAAALLVRFVHRAFHRGFAIRPELKARFPTLEARANRYLAILTILSSTIIYLLAALAILQAWGIEAFNWIGVLAQQPAVDSLISLIVVFFIGLLLWEFFSSVIERRLSSISSGRRSRARTVLPLLRTTVLVVLLAVAALMVLSAVGVNIAPLLAGAGVAGIAVGFGAQNFVKDLITGFSILLEDIFAIGDVVDVGNGHAGVVEAISIRNIRLRDMQGTVHTIPFSMVTTVKNLTRDFAYYVANVEVSYREDTDEVIAVLIEIADEIRQDPEFGPKILEPLEVVGVDAFKESSVVIVVRLKTFPLQQWSVGREFNRRMKKAFDRKGIEMPFPHRTIYFGEDKTGRAPPAHVHVEPGPGDQSDPKG